MVARDARRPGALGLDVWATNVTSGNPQVVVQVPWREWMVGRYSGLYFDIAPSGDRFITARQVGEEGASGPSTILVNGLSRLLRDVGR